MDSRRVIPGVDQGKANVARVYDVLLGGTHNYPVDRELARTLEAVDPSTRAITRVNRAFLGRTVRFLLKAGVRQFLDIGSGIPTMGNVHEVAQTHVPDARVVYVDVDTSAVAHGAALLEHTPNATIVHGDLREPGALLEVPGVRDLIDFDQPMAILLLGVLHFVPDAAEPAKITELLREALPVHGYLAVSHVARLDDTSEPPRPVATGAANGATTGAADGAAPIEVTPRSAPEIMSFFHGCPLVDPGLVPLPLWRPEADEERPPDPERCPVLGGVGRRRG